MSEFDKVIGYESIKRELMQICDMIRNREKYEKVGAKLPNGLLLHGEPGLGKSLMAKCLMDECGLNSYTIRRNKGGEDFIDSITSIFEDAVNNSPSIVLLDDMDKFANEDQGHRDAEEYVTIQAAIDDVKDKDVFVVATANDLYKLPDSLIRAGRFDRKIDVESPSKKEAAEIIEFFLKDKKVSDNINYDDLCKMISYNSCAQLEAILNEAAINAAYAGKENIEMEDLINAVLRQEYNSPDDYSEMSEEEIRHTAIHEAGHAVVSEIVEPGSVGLISIRCKGKAIVNGFVHRCESLKRRPYHILVSLGGKAAVELNRCETVASGCQNDLTSAYSNIRAGISDNAILGFELMDISTHGNKLSDSTNERTEAVVYAEMERYFMKAKDILIKNKEFLDKLTELLIEKKTLLYSDVQRVRESVTIREVYI